MIDGVITMDTSQGELNEQAQSMVGMALEAATTPDSVVAGNTNYGESNTQQPYAGWDLETRVSRTGYLASMIRYDDDTLEDTPGRKPDKLDVIRINPYIDKIPPNTETGVEASVGETGRNDIGTNRQVIKTGIHDTIENEMSRITGVQLAHQGETGNVTMEDHENFRTKVISIEVTN